MCDLELQTAVEPIHPRWAIYIHGCAEHALDPMFAWFRFFGRHGEVGDGQLEMQWECDHVTDETENDALGDGRDTAVDDQITKPSPEEDLPDEFENSLFTVQFGAEIAEDEVPGEVVEIETRDREEEIVCPCLFWNHEFGKPIIVHDTLGSCRVQRIEKYRRDGDER